MSQAPIIRSMSDFETDDEHVPAGGAAAAAGGGGAGQGGRGPYDEAVAALRNKKKLIKVKVASKLSEEQAVTLEVAEKVTGLYRAMMADAVVCKSSRATLSLPSMHKFFPFFFFFGIIPYNAILYIKLDFYFYFCCAGWDLFSW